MPFDATCFKDNNNSLNQEKDTDTQTKILSSIKSNTNNNNKKTTPFQSNSIKLYDLIAIKFPSSGKILSGFITIEYKYNPQKVTITYSNVKYSDKRMEAYLEKNPNVIRNIDSFLKNKMLESEFKLT
jgi:predicted Mrr-cat superfamily restriction endonuclease